MNTTLRDWSQLYGQPPPKIKKKRATGESGPEKEKLGNGTTEESLTPSPGDSKREALARASLSRFTKTSHQRERNRAWLRLRRLVMGRSQAVVRWMEMTRRVV